MQVYLMNVPNQEVPFVYGTNSFVLTLRLFEGLLYASVSVNGEDVVVSRRVVAGEDLFPSAYQRKAYGSIVFTSKYESSVTDYEVYNDSVQCEFTPPAEEE